MKGKSGYECFDSKSTQDKIFLLSYTEANSDAYVMNSAAARQTPGSDYSKCQGLLIEDGSLYIFDTIAPIWLLRTPGERSSDCCNVSVVGATPSIYFPVYSTDGGVRPAMKFDLNAATFKSEHNHVDGEGDNICDNCGDEIEKLNIFQRFFLKIKLFFKRILGITD